MGITRGVGTGSKLIPVEACMAFCSKYKNIPEIFLLFMAFGITHTQWNTWDSVYVNKILYTKQPALF